MRIYSRGKDGKGTYCNGYTLKITEDIKSYKNITYKLCELLSEEFNKYLDESEGVYIFDPEHSILGFSGITISSWPGKKKREWKNFDMIIKQRESGIFITVLQAFGGATWTITELKIFETCLKKFGLERISDYPSEEELTSLERFKTEMDIPEEISILE